MKVKVIRAFLHKGVVQEVGSEPEVSTALGAELVYNGKAERLGDAPARGPMTTESASELVSGAKTDKAKR